MKKRSILTFVIALVTVLSMTMVGKVNVAEAKKSPIYWYYSQPLYEFKHKYFVKWKKNQIKVYSTSVKVKTTKYLKARKYMQAHYDKCKAYKKTFKVSPKVKLWTYEEEYEYKKFKKSTKKELMTWEPERFSFRVQNGVVTGIVVDTSEYVG